MAIPIDSWPDPTSQESLALAEQLFEAIRIAKEIDSLGDATPLSLPSCNGHVPTAALWSVIQALKNSSDINGYHFSFEREEVSREEFLAALHKVCVAMGPMGFDAVISAQVKLKETETVLKKDLLQASPINGTNSHLRPPPPSSRGDAASSVASLGEDLVNYNPTPRCSPEGSQMPSARSSASTPQRPLLDKGQLQRECLTLPRIDWPAGSSAEPWDLNSPKVRKRHSLGADVVCEEARRRMEELLTDGNTMMNGTRRMSLGLVQLMRQSSTPDNFRSGGLDSARDSASAVESEPQSPLSPKQANIDRTPRLRTSTTSLTSCETSKSHIKRWHMPQETLILFDWDDTICPTSFVHEDARLKWSEPAPCFMKPDMLLHLDNSEGDADAGRTMHSALTHHAETIKTLLRNACSLGHVAIVTLAKPGWVDVSINHFLPGVKEVMDELGVEVIYARDCLTKWEVRQAMLDEVDLLLLMKEQAMRQCVHRLYTSRRSWKNIMSIGDAATERDALRDLCFLHTQSDKKGVEKKCRCKTLKLPEEPGLEQLTSELQVIHAWLEHLVLHDGDIDMDFTKPEVCLELYQSILDAADQAPCVSNAPSAAASNLPSQMSSPRP